MTRKKIISIITAAFVFAAVISFQSCEELLEQFTTQEVPVDNLELSLIADVASTPAQSVSGIAKVSAANGVNSFKGELLLDSTLFKDYASYAALVKSIKLTGVKVLVKSSDADAQSVTDFKLKTGSDSVAVTEYQFSDEYIDASELTAFAESILNKAISESTATLEWSGSTDAAQGSTVQIYLNFSGTLTVKIFESKKEETAE